MNAHSYYESIKFIRINIVEINNFFKKETKRTTVFTRELKLEALKLFGLQKFLLDFGRMYAKQTLEVSLWNYYLICAELFGIADKVRKELKNFYPELNVPIEIDLESIDDFVKVGYTSMYKARDRALRSYSSSDYDYSGSSSSSGGGGRSSSSGGRSSGGSSGGGFR